MSAKLELFSRLKYLDAALALPQMIDDGIAQSAHNGVANLLRKGVGIVAFNILEDYIKNRSYEALTFLSASGILFEKLTEPLQKASITGVLGALSVRAGLLQKAGEDWKSLVQDETLKIHSTKNATFELSKYSFFSANSNINPGEIGEFLNAFGIPGGWSSLKKVSDQIGGGLPDLAQSYRNAADRRHRAAHTASFRYDYHWLSGIKNESIAIAASLDILLSARCRQIAIDKNCVIDSHDIAQALNFRFLEQSGAGFRETNAIGGKARKNWNNFEAAVNSISPSLSSNQKFLIVLDESKRISDWYS